MAATPDPPAAVPPDPDGFRWQAFFRRSGDALFLLSRQRRILFVNAAWEALTGIPAAQARGLACRSGRGAEADAAETVGRALAPPPEVLQGRCGRARRVLRPAAGAPRCVCDVDFFPLRDGAGLLGILARVVPAPAEVGAAPGPVPAKLLALRQALAQRYTPDRLGDAAPAMRQVAAQVRLAAGGTTSVLVTGEPGCGKDWVARTIHYQGVTAERPFAAVDAAGLTEELLGPTLFGPDGLLRPGTGTVYVRAVGRLPRELQDRLVQWLADPPPRGPRVIGGITGTAADEVRAGRLLAELACALGTLTVAVPPLRERTGDLPGLVERLLERVNVQAERPAAGLTSAAWEALRAYRWPCNVRELYEALASAARRADDRIDAADLPAAVRQAAAPDAVAPARNRGLPLDALLEEAERRLILLALERARGNRSRAAEILGIWRPRLLRRMEALRLPGADAPAETSGDGPKPDGP